MVSSFSQQTELMSVKWPYVFVLDSGLLVHFDKTLVLRHTVLRRKEKSLSLFHILFHRRLSSCWLSVTDMLPHVIFTALENEYLIDVQFFVFHVCVLCVFLFPKPFIDNQLRKYSLT